MAAALRAVSPSPTGPSSWQDQRAVQDCRGCTRGMCSGGCFGGSRGLQQRRSGERRAGGGRRTAQHRFEGEVFRWVGSAAKVLQGCVWVFVWVCAGEGVSTGRGNWVTKLVCCSSRQKACKPPECIGKGCSACACFVREYSRCLPHATVTLPANNVPACCPFCVLPVLLAVLPVLLARCLCCLPPTCAACLLPVLLAAG